MTGGWAATNTLRRALANGNVNLYTAEPVIVGTKAAAALALVEAALDAAALIEAYDQAGGNEWWEAHAKLYAALRAVREGK